MSVLLLLCLLLCLLLYTEHELKDQILGFVRSRHMPSHPDVIVDVVGVFLLVDVFKRINE